MQENKFNQEVNESKLSIMEKTKAIIKELESLDLTQYPYQKVRDLIGSIGSTATLINTLHSGKIVMRARPNFGEERFSEVSQISYKPLEYNKTYQRASTPFNTMFYGSTISENIAPKELSIARVIGLFETLPIMRDINLSGEQIITYSTWRVVKDIPLISIIHYKDFQRENSYATKQRADFEDFLSKYPHEIGEKARLVNGFLAKQYAKDVTPHDYDYLISAIYAEMGVVNGLAAGVIYPSVRTGGDGFNVAIHPHFIDNGYLVPEVVGECIIYKKGKTTIVDNETVVVLEKGQLKFEFSPVPTENKEGRENILRKLYPENY